jgi:hypothetical protein
VALQELEQITFVAVNMKIVVLWDATTHSLLPFHPEDGGSRIL